MDPLVGVFGGSGFYEFLDDAVEHRVDTPYGEPAAAILVGTVAGKPVAFMARHGRHHAYPPHAVPYRANVWAMHAIGVRAIVAPCSVGSLQPDIDPGQFVIVDQLVDRTWGRPDTFHDSAPVHHQTFAEPYDARLRRTLAEAGRRAGVDVIEGGTMVVINGPRFSTAAESRWFRAMGWHVVNMTGYPEAVLSAELGMRYATVALVTDHDAGVDGHEPVTMEVVLEVMRGNVASVRQLITEAITHDYDAFIAT